METWKLNGWAGRPGNTSSRIIKKWETNLVLAKRGLPDDAQEFNLSALWCCTFMLNLAPHETAAPKQ
jgi:hypothetical protein